MEVKDVKNDLRKIRYGKRLIEEMKEQLWDKQRRLGILKGRGDDDVSRIETLEKAVKQLEDDIERKSGELAEILNKYKPAIDSLEIMDQVLVYQVYIDGKKYTEMSLLSKYSVRGIENRIKNALEKIADVVK